MLSLLHCKHFDSLRLIMSSPRQITICTCGLKIFKGDMPTHINSKRHNEHFNLKKEQDDLCRQNKEEKKREIMFGNLSPRQKLRWSIARNAREFRAACELEYEAFNF